MTVPPVANPDPFDLLGVSEEASDEAVQVAWRRYIRLCHPDNATDDADRDRRTARSIALNQARDVLLDPVRRADALRERQLRATTIGGRPYAPESPPPPPKPQDVWDGSNWSSYRAGGHPEARDPWTYQPEPSAGAAQPVSLVPRPRRGFLRILGLALRIVVESVWIVVSGVARYVVRLSSSRFPFNGDDLE
jgi:curved DNA-binding protein CbpA